ncbi:MAG: hypothetical protein CM1200mP15_13610 [Dehalococcoidia bacterium]|nr:MAG: hypothetical protein CM1200mP15_13610 [Dehalococcoidia bacterium]
MTRVLVLLLVLTMLKGNVLHKTNLKPFEGKCTVIVFDGAENLSTEASNALLKTLEEPSPQVLIILLTNNDANILDTIGFTVS